MKDGVVIISGVQLLVYQSNASAYSTKTKFHIQKCGVGVPRLVERSANVISADTFCITNILPHHMDKYKTIENILHDKTSFDRVEGKSALGLSILMMTG